MEQLSLIFNLLGTPTEENWPNASLLPNYLEFERRMPLNLSTVIKGSGWYQGRSFEVDLLLSLLSLDPRNRKSAEQVAVLIFLEAYVMKLRQI